MIAVIALGAVAFACIVALCLVITLAEPDRTTVKPAGPTTAVTKPAAGRAASTQTVKVPAPTVTEESG